MESNVAEIFKEQVHFSMNKVPHSPLQESNSGRNQDNGDRKMEKGDLDGRKEWKRTLACKLFEERHGGEGMDSLWEVYETETTVPAKKSRTKNEVDEDEVEVEVDGGEACCVQALRFSAGKGIGRRKMTKISKAIKGLGLIHVFHVSKKVHNNGDK